MDWWSSFAIEDPTKDWETALPAVEMCINNAPLAGTEYSAYYLNSGYHPTLLEDIRYTEPDGAVEGVGSSWKD